MDSNSPADPSAFWRRVPRFVPSEVVVYYSGSVAEPLKGPAATAAPGPTEECADGAKAQPDSAGEQEDKGNEQTGRAKEQPTDKGAKEHHATDKGGGELRFQAVLEASSVDIGQLQRLSWKGIPAQHRGTAWRLLMGYLPLSAGRRAATLQRKRKEYDDWVRQTFARGEDALDAVLWHQIRIDVPRTTPGSPIFRAERVQRCLERILYCWAARHPASGYVQGINDLLTPFFYVFAEPHLGPGAAAEAAAAAAAAADALDDAVLAAVEADSFWCLTRLLDGIQDNYTHAQPGIQRQIVKMKELVARIDAPLAAHLDAEGVEFIQFAFRWINCLLMREVSLESTVRMWDTYLAEPDGFSTFHIYVCAAFLLKWSKDLMPLDFQGIVFFLQHPPSAAWRPKDVELLLSEAYMYKCLYHDSPSHYSSVPGAR
ncbi:GTPase-activating protein [Coemansia javaensis]|uniref:GTPase-activating protein n=1 Tax=Coemansia javaensis TaxID=2761396 RepID=A0A9W8LJF5_9FUNG|nr:GTPase-activating protein [Coemansia javaensis]